MPYKLIRVIRQEEEAPHLRHTDLYGMAEAARLLRVTVAYLSDLMDTGTLTTVEDPTEKTPRGTPRRYVLRSEIDKLAAEREQQQ
jgi:hypothetical protein